MNAPQTYPQPRIWKLASWFITAIVVIFDLVFARESPRLVGIFANMFQQLEVSLPWPTRLFLATYVWLLPFLFIALGTFVVWKEVSVCELRRKFVLTSEVFFATLGILALAIFILYLPVLTLAAKLAEVK